MKRQTITAGLCLILQALHAQHARIDSLMRVIADRTEFSGTVLVADRGEVIYHKAFGLASREWNVPNTVESRYKLASLSKQFTALLILQLAHEGKLSLDDPLVKHIPAYRVQHAERITLRHVLSHTSGIPNYHVIPGFDSVVAKQPRTLERFVDLFLDKPLLFEPGSASHYSNLGYSALALVVERVTGKPFSEQLRTRVFEPAGMVDSFTEDDPRVMPRMAQGYVNTWTSYDREAYRDPSSVIGSGHVSSTTMDLFRYDRALRNGTLLPTHLQAAWIRPVRGDFGLGWMVMRYFVPGRDSVTVAYHDGGNRGFTTVMYRFIENDRCIVVLSNTSMYDIYGVAGRIARILHGREVPPVKRPLVQAIARILKNEGREQALAFFRRHRSDPEYTLDGAAANSLGYLLMGQGRLEDAVCVFELNVEAFPEVADPYDSLAEGYMKQGRRELAIANYKHSLELDPHNENAKVMLKKLGAP
ncbi:MAG: serine hydrolase [Flavobacteriales bacterium]|nr:MAG: serine hydrolase [Flavobacteriales bacterium]